jgi:hypothetical protein
MFLQVLLGALLAVVIGNKQIPVKVQPTTHISLSQEYDSEPVANWDAARSLYEQLKVSPKFTQMGAQFVDYTDCSPPTKIFKLEKVQLTPDPPAPGSPLQISVAGNLTEVVTEGASMILKVRYLFVTIINAKLDLCEQLKQGSNSTCPVDPSHVSFDQSFDIPSDAPQGSYSVNVNALTNDSRPIFCVNMRFKI